MSDLISRQAAIKDAESWVAVDEYEKHLQKKVVEWLKELPPAQPKRGRWIGKYPVTSVCSECGFFIHDSKVKAFAYCPNCGAEMEVTT